jgi:hypothetical protein
LDGRGAGDALSAPSAILIPTMSAAEDADYFQTFIRLRSKPNRRWLVPEELRPKLVADAEQHETSLTDVIVRILAGVYGVEVASSSRKTAPKVDGDVINVRLPMPLYVAVLSNAGPRKRSVQKQILADLCEHYKLAPPSGDRAVRAAVA